MKMDREAALRGVSYLAIRKAAGVGSQVDQILTFVQDEFSIRIKKHKCKTA